MKTAEAMFNSKRYLYAVFMCHLAIEKALKGIYTLTFMIYHRRPIIWFISSKKSNLRCRKTCMVSYIH